MRFFSVLKYSLWRLIALKLSRISSLFKYFSMIVLLTCEQKKNKAWVSLIIQLEKNNTKCIRRNSLFRATATKLHNISRHLMDGMALPLQHKREQKLIKSRTYCSLKNYIGLVSTLGPKLIMHHLKGNKRSIHIHILYMKPQWYFNQHIKRTFLKLRLLYWVP